MEYMNQPQESPMGGETPQGAQPQAGGYYQFQPGVGFVPVQGQSMQGQATQPTAGAEQTAGGQMGSQAMGPQAGAQAAPQQDMSGLYGQGIPENTQPKFDQNKIGQMYGVMTDVMNGDVEPNKLLGLFAETGGDFWKGALVGAAAVVLLNNDTVKGALAGLAASAGSMFGERDPEGEQVTLDDE
ncbi:hypothetical protein [Pseudodesulfovibrio sp.]|uniref:hypothetical protein n=1 Tax=unclassified Pseudodesulfovibrio TaxID=2661612 RepID=UPI003AFFCCF1